jgi:AraC-like DNA-binding protein
MARHLTWPVLPALSRHVLSVWSLAQEPGNACPVLPDPSVILTFGDATWRRPDGGKVRAAGAQVLGVLRQPWSVTLDEGTVLLGITLRPGAAPAFFPQPAWELTDALRPLHDTWGRPGHELVEQLAGLPVAEAAVVAQQALVSQLRGARRERWLEHASGSRGAVSVDDLARASGLSRQHLARRSRETVGVAPKLLCRLTRFQHALAFVEAPGPVDWAVAARSLGYADQSHLSAEFREFTGHPPARFVARQG